MMNLATVIVTLATLAIALARERPPVSDNKAKEYLQQFGYVGTSNLLTASSGRTADFEDSASILRSAVKKFQQFAGLRQTGELDVPTKKKMALPRCGVTDVLAVTRGGSAAYKWDRNDLTYSIESYSPDLSNDNVRRAIGQAFQTWSAVTPLTFREVSSGGNIKVRFAPADHGDPWPFDGQGGVLAHATMPSNGLLHFDEDENWVYMDANKIAQHDFTDILAVAIHESGHTLGLDHSRDENAIMAPFYQETVDERGNYKMPRLQADDISKIQAIYGSGRGSSGSSRGGDTDSSRGSGSNGRGSGDRSGSSWSSWDRFTTPRTSSWSGWDREDGTVRPLAPSSSWSSWSSSSSSSWSSWSSWSSDDERTTRRPSSSGRGRDRDSDQSSDSSGSIWDRLKGALFGRNN